MKRLIVSYMLVCAACWGVARAQIAINPDGTHSVIMGNVAINPDGTHSMVLGDILVNPNGTHSMIVGKTPKRFRRPAKAHEVTVEQWFASRLKKYDRRQRKMLRSRVRYVEPAQGIRYLLLDRAFRNIQMLGYDSKIKL